MTQKEQLVNEQFVAEMKERVFEGNLQLPEWGLVKLTWGNVSEINREIGVIVIKPSGVDYSIMRADDMVVTDLEGNILSKNSLDPSSDLPTHVELYKHFENVESIVHTHSSNSVSWAQSGRDLPVYGTTHADGFYGSIPNTRQLTEYEVKESYEVNTGKVIAETFKDREIDENAVPGVLVNGHGPFTWGTSVAKAVEHSLILDEVSLMARNTELLQKGNLLPQHIIDKHYYRKHGDNAYYGQKSKANFV